MAVAFFGLCLLAGAWLASALARPERKGIAVAVLSLWVVAYAAGTLDRGQVWRSSVALWTDTTRKEPTSALAWSQLGEAYLSEGTDLTRALQSYERALALDDDKDGRATALNSVAVIHAKQGNTSKAIESWKAVAALQPEYAPAYFNLGNLLATTAESKVKNEGRFDFALMSEAVGYLRQALEHDPRHRKALLRLVRCQAQTAVYAWTLSRDPAGARAALEEAEQARQQLGRLGDQGFVTEADQILAAARRNLLGTPAFP